MLGSLNREEVQVSSISRVVDQLRIVKEEAYKPKLFSIGLLHGGSKRQPQLMEDPKLHYMRDFLDRQETQEQNISQSERLRECGSDLLELEKVIRESYKGNIELESDEIAKIMVVDGCFLLELLISLGDYMKEGKQTTSYDDDPILVTKENVLVVLNDITMLENQIPFIVLKKLYRKVYPDGSEIEDDHRVANIVRKAFGYPLTNSPGGAHILHLMHLSTLENYSPWQQEDKRAKQELFRCANKLLVAGVILQSSSSSSRRLRTDRFDFNISFKRGELDIPTLYVKETTEVKWRNLIAWEQSKTWTRGTYTSYALFFKGLICCKHDIELLIEKGIIVNATRMNNEDLLRLFGTISVGAKHMESSYTEICNGPNEYKGNEYKGNIVTRVFRQFHLVAWHQCRRVISTKITSFLCLKA